jgi:AraC-like DNA-binding protein
LRRRVWVSSGAVLLGLARRWTVASLALEVGMSRSGFAARFGQLVGDGPIEYLTRWRMLLAGRSLSPERSGRSRFPEPIQTR